MRSKHETNGYKRNLHLQILQKGFYIMIVDSVCTSSVLLRCVSCETPRRGANCLHLSIRIAFAFQKLLRVQLCRVLRRYNIRHLPDATFIFMITCKNPFGNWCPGSPHGVDQTKESSLWENGFVVFSFYCQSQSDVSNVRFPQAIV